MATIKINVTNQRAFIWDIKDIQILRVQHHICGILTGTLPQVGQQNIFLGLPLMLLPEEVVLLVKNKIAYLVDDAKAHLNPTPEQAVAYHSAREISIRAQQEESVRIEEEKRAAMNELYKDKIEKKRIEKEAKKELLAKVTVKEEESTPQTNSTLTSSSVLDSFEILVSDEPTASQPDPSLPSTSSPTTVKSTTPRDVSSVAYTILIHPSSISAPWYSPDSFKYTTLDSAKEAGIWNYPTNAVQESRCLVFEDLWKRGHFMGGGLRFGGDFLIYPGDPLRFHSHFTLTVLASTETAIMPMDIVAYGRLATGVKKAHLLGSWNREEEKAEYLSLEWSSFG